MRKWLFAFVVSIVVLSLFFSACAPAPTPAPEVEEQVEVEEPEEVVVETEAEAEAPAETEVVEEETPVETEVVEEETPAEEVPAEKKVITFAWTQEPDSLNPFYTDMWFSAILQQLYLCWAWEFDDQNVAFPHLVTEIPSMDNGGLSEDGLTITLNLRDDIVWSDGTPITSADFKFTYDMIMADGNAVFSQYPYDYLEAVETPDERTVVMKFTEPFAPWLANFWRGILPKHVLEPVFEAEGSMAEAEWNSAPTVTCGPYVFDDWESGSFLRFTKNENYWKGVANIDEVFMQFVPDDAAQTAALAAGDADLGTFPPLSDVPKLQEAGLTVFSVNGGYSEGWFFNMRDMASPGVKDLVVRQAIAKSIDKQAIVDDLLLGLTEPAETYWDALKAGGFVSPDLVPWEFDPDGARQMLEEAGYVDSDGDGIREDADGNPLTLYHGTTIREIRQDIQAVTQQYLKDVGIDLQIQSWDADIFFGSYADAAPPAMGEVDIMEWSDSTYFPDPDTDYWLCSQIPTDENPWGYNYFICDEKLDALLQEQLVEINPDARAEIIREISTYVHDQVYWLGLYVDPDMWIVSNKVSNVKFSGVTPFYNIMEWDMTE
jgi:peptide/nickel transport system substrate-binding protein